MKTVDVNNKHPELREGELLLTNCVRDENEWVYHREGEIGCKYQRKGDVAYNIYGKVIPDSFSVFILKKEFEDAGLVPETEFSVIDLEKVRKRYEEEEAK